jgi:hypothetical protein
VTRKKKNKNAYRIYEKQLARRVALQITSYIGEGKRHSKMEKNWRSNSDD